MRRIEQWVSRRKASLGLAAQALVAWSPRQLGLAATAAVVVGVVVGLVTVLIPNPVFGREIPPEPWNYPVWIVTSALTGILFATYVRPGAAATSRSDEPAAAGDGSDRRSARLGGFAAVLAWFAVGCPVCNKIALLALGYTGALTWFAPAQPVLAATALVLFAVAVVRRLQGQVVCPVPAVR
ncbi:hypothetical protein [Nocardia flavorosea]|uniref:Integral membrane protein n=1 Tax=Nocardia flavorosea TaxID=53429 RepID=A0A846YNH8_9NOCA|nr:hypothetical protein [Nocardia flavorosea]NKY60677.1 hypothetical protein [Nocardia flavorosea]